MLHSLCWCPLRRRQIVQMRLGVSWSLRTKWKELAAHQYDPVFVSTQQPYLQWSKPAQTWCSPRQDSITNECSQQLSYFMYWYEWRDKAWLCCHDNSRCHCYRDPLIRLIRLVQHRQMWINQACKQWLFRALTSRGSLLWACDGLIRTRSSSILPRSSLLRGWTPTGKQCQHYYSRFLAQYVDLWIRMTVLLLRLVSALLPWQVHLQEDYSSWPGIFCLRLRLFGHCK